MSSEVKEYVLGFAFNEDNTKVILIRKNRPEWQNGFLNGVGGKIESYDENPEYAMAREMFEETGVKTFAKDWKFISTLEGIGYNNINEKLFIYSINLDISQARTIESEEIFTIEVSNLSKEKTLPNVQWLIPLILNLKKDRANYFQIKELY